MQQALLRFFRFTGRLGRPGLALHIVVWLAAMLALMLAATEVFDLTISDAAGRFWDEAVPNALLMVLLYWTVMALSAQRLRDMGFRPLPFLVLFAAVDFLETWVLPQLTETRLPAPLEMFTPLGGLLSLASVAWLLFWPSAAPPSTEPVPSSGRPDPGRRNDASPPPPA